MKQLNYKKLILPNIPYVFFVYLFDYEIKIKPRVMLRLSVLHNSLIEPEM